MNFELTPAQHQLTQDLRALLQSWPGAGSGDYDAPLQQELQRRGIFSLAHAPHGCLSATLAAEVLSRANAMVPAGVAALVAPLFPSVEPGSVVSLRKAGSNSPVRFARQASWLVEVGTDKARLYPLASADVDGLDPIYVYPMARTRPPAGTAREDVDARVVQRRWQMALSAEMVGALDGALDKLLGFLREREQFGRVLGSFQALQHRASEMAVTLECARLLSRQAAWLDDDEAVATAACYAATAARFFCTEIHQMTGARGFTLDFGLHQWTLRLQLLGLEAGGPLGHADVAAAMADARSVNGQVPYAALIGI